MHLRRTFRPLHLSTIPVAAVIVGACAAAQGPEPSWPRFHGPMGDNISTETGLLEAWPEGGPTLLWTAQGLGNGYGTVAIADGMICAVGDIGDSCVITAMDPDATVRWQVENGASWKESVPGGRSTPTIHGGRIYWENAHGAVVCLDAASGEKLWGRNVVDEFGGKYSGWGYADSLAIDGDRVICSPGGDTAMVALDGTTGETVWQSPSSGEPAGYSAPVLGEYQGLRMLLTMSERSVIGVNADTGDLLFRFEHVNPRYVANCVSPIYHDGRVFITSGYGVGCVVLQVTVDGPAAAVEPVWRTEDLDNRHGGVILLDGYLYGASQVTNKGNWCCLKWETGELVYAEPGVGEGSSTCAEGMLYTLSENGRVGLVKATPTGHEVISQFALPGGGEGPTWAHPVVCGGRLYIRHGDRLYAYDVWAQ